jgi:hypothetical protein
VPRHVEGDRGASNKRTMEDVQPEWKRTVEHTMLTDAQISAVYQAACLVLMTYEELQQVRTSYASPPFQWPQEAQVSEWPAEARYAYDAATRRYLAALNRLVELVPEALAPLHFVHGSRQIVRIAYEDVQDDPRGGTFITVTAYPLLIPDAADTPSP